MKKYILSILISVILLFTITSSIKAATYYVSQAGNDSNNGTSSSTPWKHHPWDANAANTALATVLSGDDIVYMRRGDVWYDTFLNANDAGSSEHQITTTSINTFFKTSSSDALPKLSGAYDPATLSWTLDSSTIYHTTAATQPNIVVYNNTTLTLDNNTSPALNKWYWTASTLYVNVGEIPTNGTLEAGKRNFVNLTAAAFHTYSYLEMRVANTTTGGVAFNNGFNSIIYDNLTINNYAEFGIYQLSSTSDQVTNCTLSKGGLSGININSAAGAIVTGNSVTGNSDSGIRVNNSANTIIRNNSTFSNTYGINFLGSSDGFDISSNTSYSNAASGIVVTTAGSGSIYSNTVYNNAVSAGSGNGIQISSSNSNNVYLNNIHDNANGYYPTGYGNGISLVGSSASNNVYRNTLDGNYIGINLTLTSGNSNNVVSYNLLTNTRVNGIDIESSSSSGYEQIYNNTVIHNPSANNSTPYTGHGIDVQTSGTKIKFANNIIVVEQTGTNSNGLVIAGSYTDVWTDNNLLFDATSGHDGNIAKLNGTQYTSFTSWQAAVQADSKIKDMNGNQGLGESHSINADPLFQNINTDYRLLSGSPAIDSAFNLNLTTDYQGNTVPYGSRPDIGAIEYVPIYINTSNNQNGGTSSCGDSAPFGLVDLFEIDRNGKTATLYFTPTFSQTQYYNVVYGFKTGDERFGGTNFVPQNSNKGVQSIKINFLNPYQAYSFKIVPVNGCASGSWSNWLDSKGQSSYMSSLTKFYRYLKTVK